MRDVELIPIRDAFVAKLGTVLRDTGFNTDLGQEGHVHVRRKSLATLTPAEFPRTTVVWGHVGAPAEGLDGATDQDNLGAMRDSVAYFAVIVQVQSDDPDLEILRAMGDCNDVILADPTLGGVCSLVRFVSAGGDFQEFADVQRGEVGILYAVEYNWSPTA